MILLKRFDRFCKWIEDALLVSLLAGMILLATGQILLRNLFESGFIWGDELLRIMLLWLTLFGAMAASRDDKHINVDVISRFLPQRVAPWMRSLLDLFTTTVCWVIAWYSLQFVRTEAEFGSQLLGQLPSWWFQAVIPFGFALIGLRYLLFLLGRCKSLPLARSNP